MTAIVSPKIDLQKYARLVARAKPLVIETEAELQRADEEIGRLLRKGANNLSVEEDRLLMLLTPRRLEPSCAASRMRCASPPDNVGAERSKVR